MPDLIGLIAVLGAFSIPIVAIITTYRHKALQLKLMSGNGSDNNLVAEIQELKRQLIDMRDTTTRYDMSFDSALQRMDNRLGAMEVKVRTIESNTSEQQTLLNG